jgi:hypothetical protein
VALDIKLEDVNEEDVDLDVGVHHDNLVIDTDARVSRRLQQLNTTVAEVVNPYLKTFHDTHVVINLKTARDFIAWFLVLKLSRQLLTCWEESLERKWEKKAGQYVMEI